MSQPVFNIDWPTSISKGDSIILPCKVDQNIADWKIRCEIFDNCLNSIKLATVNSGGTLGDIVILDEANGSFQISVAKNLTTCFQSKSSIEIEIENDSEQIFTVFKKAINFKNEQITWTDPAD